MATVTTFTRPQVGAVVGATGARDTTPSALGMVGSIVVTEDASADGGATVAASDGAFAWTTTNGAAIDPRTGRPFRLAPWVPAWPTDLLSLVTERPMSAYVTPPPVATRTYAVLLATLAARLGAWGWSQSSDES